MQLEANNEEIAASIAEGGNSRAKRESLRYEVGVLICMALPNMDMVKFKKVTQVPGHSSIDFKHKELEWI